MQNSVKGWRNGAGAGSDCNDANTWRVYCFANGESNATCNLNCQLGNVHGGHSPCSCNSVPRYSHNWCENYR